MTVSFFPTAQLATPRFPYALPAESPNLLQVIHIAMVRRPPDRLALVVYLRVSRRARG